MLRRLVALRLGSVKGGAMPAALSAAGAALPASATAFHAADGHPSEAASWTAPSQTTAFDVAVAARERASTRMQTELFSPKPEDLHGAAPLGPGQAALVQVIAAHRCARTAAGGGRPLAAAAARARLPLVHHQC